MSNLFDRLARRVREEGGGLRPVIPSRFDPAEREGPGFQEVAQERLVEAPEPGRVTDGGEGQMEWLRSPVRMAGESPTVPPRRPPSLEPEPPTRSTIVEPAAPPPAEAAPIRPVRRQYEPRAAAPNASLDVPPPADIAEPSMAGKHREPAQGRADEGITEGSSFVIRSVQRVGQREPAGTPADPEPPRSEDPARHVASVAPSAPTRAAKAVASFTDPETRPPPLATHAPPRLAEPGPIPEPPIPPAIAEPAPAPPSVRVSIGRLEVHVAPPRKSPPHSGSAPAPRLTDLNGYLDKLERGR